MTSSDIIIMVTALIGMFLSGTFMCNLRIGILSVISAVICGFVSYQIVGLCFKKYCKYPKFSELMLNIYPLIYCIGVSFFFAIFIGLDHVAKFFK